jgi:hypothetical protein
MNGYVERLSTFLFSKNLKNIEILIISILLFLGFCRNLQSVEFQPDETFWVASSVRLDRFLAGDFDSPVWDQPFVNYEVRPIPSYIVAISQRAGGIRTDSLPVYWDWNLTNEENIARGAMPSDIILWWSRLPMGIISVFSLLGLALFLAKTHSRIAAYIFTSISFNDYFLLHLRRAMSEAPLLLFTVFVLFASYRLLLVMQESPINKMIFWSVVTGALSGLAGQSKLTGLACGMIPIPGALIMIFKSTLSERPSRLRLLFGMAGLVLCTSLLVFIISYPFFYENTLFRTVGTFYFRNAVVAGQAETYASQVILPGDRMEILFQRIFKYPISFDSSSLTNTLFHGINFLVFAFGSTYSIRQMWKKERGWERYAVLLSGTLTCAIPMLFIPFDWDRYYLYPIFFSCIFFSIGLGQLLFTWLSRTLKIEKNPVWP